MMATSQWPILDVTELCFVRPGAADVALCPDIPDQQIHAAYKQWYQCTIVWTSSSCSRRHTMRSGLIS